ncbi:hypothetical protein DPMN_109064 [Dreissena polymorpha]|uniref:Uncharacterized protein n=1 Tax=Dreissena polymorpha TaxID=45954 RepID=A0A9D4K9Z9_DREPO|nr:hypothetical protein DPMN_109064 [Dreissena polymorpha]
MDNEEVYTKQKKQMETDIEHLKNSPDKLVEKAERRGKMQFVCEANLFGRTAKDKKVAFDTLSNKLDDTVKTLQYV